MSSYNNGTMKQWLAKWGLVAIMLLVFCSFTVSSQDDRRQRRGRRGDENLEQLDSMQLPELTDSMRAVRDSIHRADSAARVDSVNMLSKSSLEAPAFTTAKDSIVEDFSNGKRMIYYYGEVSVSYANMKLTADYMEYDLSNQTLYARGTKDSTGVITGRPVMEQGGKSYTMEEVRYNFATQKARITNMVTQEEEGILHGQNIKMMPDKSINITKGKYTVCDCEHPHYYLALTAAKVITQPSQKTVFGPAYPVIEDVPLPIGLPFGFIPNRPDRATGILFPTFGEEHSRGFYIRDLGLYFVIGEYFDIALTGDIYTLGSWAVDLNSRYKVNYKCSGNFSLTYSNDQAGEKGSSDFFQTKNFGVRWSHSQDAKARPGTSFTASVNFSSPSNNRYNSTNVQEALQNQISSSISYSKNWNGKFNLSINALHNQNSRDSSYSFTLPNVTFSVSRFYPFKRKNRVGKERFYEKFSLGYNTSLQNKINFKASEFNQPGFFDKFQNGMAHNFQIGLPNFTLLKYINITPSVSYGMNWFFRQTEKEAVVDPETGRVSVVDVKGKAFGHFGATHNYSGSISMNTRLYGLFNFGKHRKLQAIRHVVSPSLSASFSPDKGTYFNGWRTLEYQDGVNADGTPKMKTLDYNIYAGQVNGYPSKGKTGSLNFSLGNNFEAKVRDLRDTTGTGTKKIKLIDQLNLSTGYNFLADSLKMNNVGVTMSTSIFGKLGVNANMNFDPYAILVDENNRSGKRINKFALNEGQGLMRLTNASVSLSYSLSGDGKIEGNDGRGQSSSPADHYQRIYYHPITGEYIPGGWLYYTNPNVPWSVNFNYSFSYRKAYQYSNGQVINKKNFTQTLGVSGNVKLTPRLSMNLSTNFDLMALKMSTTQLSATYDLHCFKINVSWIPSGQWESWSFCIQANAAALSDLLKYKKSSSYWDNAY